MRGGLEAGTVSLTGADGDQVEGYAAHPRGDPSGGVVVIHRTPTTRAPARARRLRLQLDAAVDCYGAFVLEPPPEEVARLDTLLDELGKEHEFHLFDDAGHAFFAVDRPAYRPAAATEGWRLVRDFLGRNLAGGGGIPVHAQAEHTMNIDVANPGRSAGERVAVELTTDSAVELVRAVAQVLARVLGDLTGVEPERAERLLQAAEELAGA